MTLTLSGSNGLSDVDGSAATPAIRGTDANTGMFFPAADTIAFAEGGAEVMRIDSSGNVGIGSASMSGRLQVRQDQDGTTRSILQNRNGSGTPIVELDFITGAYDLSDNRYAYIQSGGSSNQYLAFGTGQGASPSERMRIDSSGNVDFLGSSGSTTNRLRFTYNAGSGEATIGPNSTGGSTFLTLGTSNAGTYAERARITAAGEVYIAGTTDQGAYNLQCNGTGVWGAGAYVNGSDARIKEEVSSLSSGLDVVTKLNPVQFRYKSDWSKDTSLQPGFIAQELKIALADQPYVDGVVQEGPQYMSVAYQTLIPVLVKAIQELKAQNDAFEARLAVLEAK